MNKNYTKTARRYARSLLEVADEKNRLEKIFQDVQALKKIVEETPLFSALLKDPSVPVSKKHDVLKKIFEGKADPLMLSFLMLLADNDKLKILKKILSAFEKIYTARQGILKATVTSAVPLREDQLQHISERLTKFLHQKIESKLKVDASLRGGFKVQIGDMIYDFTVKTQLDNFRQKALAV